MVCGIGLVVFAGAGGHLGQVVSGAIRQFLHRQAVAREKIAVCRGMAKASGNTGFSNGR